MKTGSLADRGYGGSAKCLTPFGCHYSGNTLQIGRSFNIRPSCQKFLNFCFSGEANLCHQPAIWLQCRMCLWDKALVDVHPFPSREHSSLRLELAYLLLYFVCF